MGTLVFFCKNGFIFFDARFAEGNIRDFFSRAGKIGSGLAIVKTGACTDAREILLMKEQIFKRGKLLAPSNEIA